MFRGEAVFDRCDGDPEGKAESPAQHVVLACSANDVTASVYPEQGGAEAALPGRSEQPDGPARGQGQDLNIIAPAGQPQPSEHTNKRQRPRSDGPPR